MCEIGGVETEIIIEPSNSHSFKAYLQGVRESGNAAFVNPGGENFKDYIKLPGESRFKRAALLHIPLAFEKIKSLEAGVKGISRVLARKMRTA